MPPLHDIAHVGHVEIRTPVPAYLRDTLGALVTEQIVLDDGGNAGSWTTFTNKSFHTHGTPPVEDPAAPGAT